MTAPACRAPLAALAGAALALAVAAPGAQAQSLGRLFTTPEQRVMLDEMRHQAQIAPAPEPEPEPPVITRAPLPGPAGPVVTRLTVNGVIQRRGGGASVWVNGDEVPHGGATREGIRVQQTGRGGGHVHVRLPSGAQSIELKPGQQIDVLSGTVIEPYEKLRAAGSGPSAFEQPQGRPAGSPSPAPAAAPQGAIESDRGAGAVAPAPAADRSATAQRLEAIATLPAAEQARVLEQLQQELGADAGAQDSPGSR